MLGRSACRLIVGASALVAVGALSAPAFAQHGHSYGPRMGTLRAAGMSGGFGQLGGPRFGGLGRLGGFGGGGGLFGGGGFGGPGGRGPGGLGPGGPGGGAGGALSIDVLTPAAAFLGISSDTLAADLKGGKTLAQEATAKGKTAADLIAAVVASEKKVFDAEVAAGWITSTQETALVTQVTNQITDLINNGPPVVSTQQHQSLLQLAATFLGMTTSDLQTDLKGGKTLAQEATAKGKTVADLVTALEAPTKTTLDSQVTAGNITQAQENTILSKLTTALTNFANGTSSQTSTTNAMEKTVAKYTLATHYTLRFSLHR